MNSQEHISEEKLTQYALAMLPATEMGSLKAHFMLCSNCREALRLKSMALAAFGATTPQVFTPAGSRDRFLEQLAGTEQTAVQGTSQAPSNWLMRHAQPGIRWTMRNWPVAASVLLAIALLGISIGYIRVVTHLQNINSQVHEGQMDSVRMNELMELLGSVKAHQALLNDSTQPTPTTPIAQVIYSPEHGTLYFIGTNFHPLQPGKSYELWILQGNQQPPIPVGSFTPNNNGNATLIPSRLPDNLNVAGYAVTIEDVMGLTTPTLPYVVSTKPQ